MLEILIIADDLTGAADCGAACAARGLETVVVLDDSGGIPQADVLAFDANTRGMTAERAAAETARIVREYPARIVYKKIDSTLRGHVAVEVAAALEAYRGLGHPEARAVVAPAFPSMGRTTKNGRMYVRGEAIENRDVGLLLEDAETDEDLRGIVSKWMCHEAGVVWAGSAGLARWLAPERERRDRAAAPKVTGAIVIAVGSPSRRSLEQAEALRGTEVGDDVILVGEAAALAETIARSPERIGGLVLTGGETARAVLSRLGIAALRVVGEVETGVPIMIAEGSRPLPVVTKAGDFGDRETLVACRAALRGLSLD
ncbi:MAG TPA: four-carbon acid sugar kinase family protein [Bryobacteraceae bacterium]